MLSQFSDTQHLHTPGMNGPLNGLRITKGKEVPQHLLLLSSCFLGLTLYTQCMTTSSLHTDSVWDFLDPLLCRQP